MIQGSRDEDQFTLTWLFVLAELRKPSWPLPPQRPGRLVTARPLRSALTQTRSAAIRRYWKEPSLYELMNASSMPVTREDVARSSQ